MRRRPRGLTATLTQANDAIAPLADKSDHIAMLFTAMTALGVVVTIVGIVWGIYARKRRAELHDALDVVRLRRCHRRSPPQRT